MGLTDALTYDKVAGMRALLRTVLLVGLAAGTLLAIPAPGMTSPKHELDYFLSGVINDNTDAAGLQTGVSMQVIDGATPDTVFLSVTRNDLACRAPDAGCPYVLLDGVASEAVAEGDVRIHPNLRSARVTTTVTFVDAISGSRCAMTIDLKAHATSEIFLEGYDDVSGFRRAEAAGTITCGGEKLLSGPVDSDAEIGRYAR